MSKKSLLNFVFSFFLFAVLFAATVSAQTNSCAVKMEVTLNESETFIKGAGATAVNTKTKKIHKSLPKAGMPYFAKLPDGNYRVTVSKVGYKQTVDDYSLDCSTTENNEDVWAIELWKGNQKQIVKIYNSVDNKVMVGSTNGEPRRGDVKTATGSTVVSTTDDTALGQSTNSVPKVVSGGVVNSKSTNLVKPTYPQAARAVRASGAVNVQVTIDENGNVISASAVSGHPLLRQAAEQAARASKFAPTLLSGQPVKVTGIIVYNFVP